MKNIFHLLISIIAFSSLLSCGGGSNQNKSASSGNQASTAQKPAAEPKTLATGEQEYSKYCLSCHQPDGNGVRGQFPPLAGNDVITGPADSLISIVLFGLEGPIVVNGETQNYTQVMPAQDYLTDQQIADVLSFVRSSWGNKASSIKPEEVAVIRKTGKKK